MTPDSVRSDVTKLLGAGADASSEDAALLLCALAAYLHAVVQVSKTFHLKFVSCVACLQQVHHMTAATVFQLTWRVLSPVVRVVFGWMPQQS